MKRAQQAAQSRERLDVRLSQLGSARTYTPPVRGWVRAIREALGMTAEQLAQRLKVKQPTVVNLEASEAHGTITLQTLRRAAAALDCELVYVLIPKKSLQETVRARACDFLRRRRAPVEHTMLLEDQKVNTKDEEARLDEALREMNPSLFWD